MNVFNPFNAIIVYSYSGVLIDPNNTKKNDLVLEFDSGSVVQQGQQFLVENGYFGNVMRKRLWIRNTSEESINIVNVSAINSGDLTFNIGKHLPDDDVKQLALSALAELSNQVQKHPSSREQAKDCDKILAKQKKVDVPEDSEFMSAWAHPQGCVAYDPVSLGLWDQTNADDHEFSEDRVTLDLDSDRRWGAHLNFRSTDGPNLFNYYGSLSLSSREEVTVKPSCRVALTISYRPTPGPKATNDVLDAGGLRPLVLIFSIFSRQLIRGRSATDNSHHFWWRSYSAHSPSIVHNLFAFKTQCCWSIISVQPSFINFGECSIGEYYTAELTISNQSDLPALVLPHVNNETIGIPVKEVRVPPRDQFKIQMDYVAKVITTDLNREALLYNAYNPACSPKIEVKAKHVDPNQILSHSIFYKILTRNKRRQLQIYFDRAFYNTPSVRVFSIRNIYSEPLRLSLKSCDPYEMSLYTYSSNTSITFPKTEEKNQYLEDLKWGESSPMSRRIMNIATLLSNRRSNSSLDLSDESSGFPILNTSERKRDSKSHIEDCIKLFENPGFPFNNSLLPDVVNGDNESSTVDRIKLVYKCVRDLKESLPDLIQIDGLECTLDVGKTYDFLVIYEPRSHGIFPFQTISRLIAELFCRN